MTGNSLVRWNAVGEKAQTLFRSPGSTHALGTMQSQTFSRRSTGKFRIRNLLFLRPLNWMNPKSNGVAMQADAAKQTISAGKIISTDPPYYDKHRLCGFIGLFYVWLRTLNTIYLSPTFFGTLEVPKAEELVATAYRHGSKEKAETFFLDGMTSDAPTCRESTPRLSRHYLTMHSNSLRARLGTDSTGWETFLDALFARVSV